MVGNGEPSCTAATAARSVARATIYRCYEASTLCSTRLKVREALQQNKTCEKTVITGTGSEAPSKVMDGRSKCLYRLFGAHRCSPLSDYPAMQQTALPWDQAVV